MSLMDLLHALALTEGRIAVEVNGEIVPRSQFAAQQINHKDKIEIVQAIGGG
jgi:sulfur carrier protein